MKLVENVREIIQQRGVKDVRKCVNCEEKIINFKMKNIDANHSAFHATCPYYKKEVEKQRYKLNSSW